jgi:phospholipase C
MDISTKIKRVFVLMLENRSFDHMLGFSDITGVDAKTGKGTTIEGLRPNRYYNEEVPDAVPPSKREYAHPGAEDKIHGEKEWDPGHEFQDTLECLSGPSTQYQPSKPYPSIRMNGFLNRYMRVKPTTDRPRRVMDCFHRDDLPILTFLAEHFSVCDHWFSSMPGPTWPNRLFVHAGSSAWLDDSPTFSQIAARHTYRGYEFEYGHVFEWLDLAKIPWRIYEGDRFPQALSLSGMNYDRLLRRKFRSLDRLALDLQADHFEPRYIFIEPKYGRFWKDFEGGNSQHPLDSVRAGEKLIAQVCDAIGTSRYWTESMLVISHDEHGGFYDHVPPGPATPPNDKKLQPENHMRSFDFTQLGVRVPTVVISPWIPCGTIDHTIYDHASILKTLLRVFPELSRSIETRRFLSKIIGWTKMESVANVIGEAFSPLVRAAVGPFSDRIRHANDFSHLFSLSQARRYELPRQLLGNYDNAPPTQDRMGPGDFGPDGGRIPTHLYGFLHVGLLRYKAINRDRPLSFDDPVVRQYTEIRTLQQAYQFLEEVRVRAEEFQQRIEG